MADNSLTNFANVLYSEAVQQKENVEKQLGEERAKILAKKREELDTKLKFEIKKCRAELKHELGLAVSTREAELSKLLRQNRAEKAENIFKEVAKKLINFTKTPEYETFLKNEFKGAAEEFCEGQTVCSARKCDFSLIEKLCPVKDIEVIEASDDIIGGFTLRNNRLGIFADCTLKSKLDEQRDLFCSASELVID